MAKSPAEIEHAEDVISAILDSYLEVKCFPYKKDVAAEARKEYGLRINQAHLSGGVVWAKGLTRLTSYAQELALSRGIYPEENRKGNIAKQPMATTQV